jgi:hypothetical protein
LEFIGTARFRSTNAVELSSLPANSGKCALETRVGGHVADEAIAWHPQSHLTFRLIAISVEEFRIEPMSHTWTLARHAVRRLDLDG